ncbi:MAG: hypothetical protein ACK5OB_16350 [Pirellula sp.]
MKAVDTLTQHDLEKHRVWRFANNREEWTLKPVTRLPCVDLKNKVASTKLMFADGSVHWGLVGNFDVEDRASNEHFLTVSILHEGRWFHLARYFDHDFSERGPEALAAFFSKSMDEIFPISGSLAGLLAASANDLELIVPAKPSKMLRLEELMAMAVPKPKP